MCFGWPNTCEVGRMMSLGVGILSIDMVNTHLVLLFRYCEVMFRDIKLSRPPMEGRAGQRGGGLWCELFEGAFSSTYSRRVSTVKPRQTRLLPIPITILPRNREKFTYPNCSYQNILISCYVVRILFIVSMRR